MGFLLVTAVLVVTLGRLGDMYGRVKIYNLGFVVFTVASIALSLDPFTGGAGALWLIVLAGRPGRRRRDAVRQLDGDPHRRVPGRPARHGAGHQPGRGDRRLVPRPDRSAACSPSGTGARCSGSACRSASSARSGRYRSLHETRRARHGRRSTVPGNLTFARRPDRAAGRDHLRHPALRRPHHGLDQPVGARRARSAASRCWSCSCVIETAGRRTPMFHDAAVPDPGVRARATWPACSPSIGRGGLQFMLIIWLQGIWLPLHGYDYESTPRCGPASTCCR